MDGALKLRILCDLNIATVLALPDGDDMVAHRVQLWAQFADIYGHLRSWGWKQGMNADVFEADCRALLVHFLETPNEAVVRDANGLFVRKRGGGYLPEDVTP